MRKKERVQNRRILTALVISIAIYALLIFLYFKNVSKVEIPSKKSESHVVKLSLIDLPKPVAPKTVESEATPSSAPVPKTIPKVKQAQKEVVKKPVDKKVKVVKKEAKVVKKAPEKKIIKKVVPKEPVPKKRVEKEVTPAKVLTKESEALQKFEEEMVYIPDATLQPSTSRQQETPTQQANDLGSFLAMPPSASSMNSYPSDKVRKLYGEEYHQFTAVQKKFIKDNLESIQQITQRTLTRRGYPAGAGETGQEGTNVVSFNLHPNGDISNLRLKSKIGYRALDENTITLIKVAYKDYPYPSTTTKIVFYVSYSIYGY